MDRGWDGPGPGSSMLLKRSRRIVRHGDVGSTAGQFGEWVPVGSEHFDGKRERALLARPQRTHADDLTRDFVAALIFDRDQNRIFPRFAGIRMPNRPFYPKRRK